MTVGASKGRCAARQVGWGRFSARFLDLTLDECQPGAFIDMNLADTLDNIDINFP